MKSPIFVVAGLVCVFGASNSAGAVVLEQKWQAGKTLTYDTDLSGSVNVQIPADVPFILAGVPLDIEVQGQGKTELKILRVDEAGTGTVSVKMPEFAINAQTFGQTAKLTVRDGKSGMTLNGKAVDWGKDLGARFASSAASNSALKIGRDGRVRGFEVIDAKAPTVGNAPAGQNAKTPATAPEKAIDRGAMISALVIQALPTLLPTQDVQTGDKWNSEVKFAPIAKTDAQTGEVLPLGNFDMVLKGQEIVEGRELWRIGVKGQVEVDGAKINALGEKAAPNAGGKPRPQLESAFQKVEGDIWFDAEAGQIARADLILGSNASSRIPGKNGKLGDPSWLDFNGTLQMKLAGNV